MMTPFRIGHGFDVHKLVVGRPLIVGGVTIPFIKGSLGHSDADVLLHAISDALLGAAALADLGHHFPDNDAKYKGISSLVILKEVGSLLSKHGFIISNVDATIVLQEPKLKPFIPQMIENISGTLNLNNKQVSVKATTTEGLSFEGVGEGISATAVALVYNSGEV